MFPEILHEEGDGEITGNGRGEKSNGKDGSILQDISGEKMAQMENGCPRDSRGGKKKRESRGRFPVITLKEAGRNRDP
jgi:hypothetical protein